MVFYSRLVIFWEQHDEQIPWLAKRARHTVDKARDLSLDLRRFFKSGTQPNQSGCTKGAYIILICVNLKVKWTTPKKQVLIKKYKVSLEHKSTSLQRVHEYKKRTHKRQNFQVP